MYSNRQHQRDELLTRIALVVASMTLLLLLYVLVATEI